MSLESESGILISDDVVASFLNRSKGRSGGELFRVSRNVISFLYKKYPNHPFPQVFDALYRVSFLNLLKSYEGGDFDEHALYVFTSLLITEWGVKEPDRYDLVHDFCSRRPKLNASNAVALVRCEISLVERTIENAKAVANYDSVQAYIKDVKNYDARLAELREIQDDANKLKSVLDKYTEAFNFVGLYKGFSDLRKRKEREKNFRLFFLFILGGAALAPLIAKVYVALVNSAKMTASELVNVADKSSSFLDKLSFDTLNVDLAAALSFVGLELLILYFFRVTLHSLKSVRAQLLQIDLRMTLCQFIDKYAEYAQGKGEALKGFESVIFSGLVSVEEKLPATFDGFDVLQGIAEKLGRK